MMKRLLAFFFIGEEEIWPLSTPPSFSPSLPPSLPPFLPSTPTLGKGSSLCRVPYHFSLAHCSLAACSSKACFVCFDGLDRG